MWLFLLQLVLVFGFVLAVSIKRLPVLVWMPSFAILLLLLSVFTTPPWVFLGLCWIVWLGLAVLLGVPPLRYRVLTQPLMERLNVILPPMSETERAALEAGDVWWEADLFRGRPDWKQLMGTTLPPLTQEEQAFLDNQVETLCGMLDDFKIVTQDHDLSKEVWEYLKKERFFGMIIPKEFGGLGFSGLAHSSIVVKIATRSVSASVDMMVPNSLGPAELLLHYGTPEQKQYYLPRLARGEEIPCFGLTGPEAGSDAAAIPDTGVVCKGQYDGKEVLGIRLNFDKRYITLAPVATVVGLAFRLSDPEHLLGDKKDIGITLALIPAKHPGVEIGERHDPMSLAFMNGPIRGKDVFIPLDWVIGGPAKVGQGWRMLMECLAAGRSISLPALSTAIAQLSYRMTGAYSLIRKQFKLPVGYFEGVEEALASIAGLTYLIEAARRVTVAAVDSHLKPAVASAIVKCHLTEMGRQVLNNAMDVHGGRGIQLGPRNYLGLYHFGVPISITVEGANILTRNLIIFGQGVFRCHPYVQAEMAAIANSDLKAFDKLLLSHIGYAVSNLVAVKAMNLGAAPLFVRGKSPVVHYYRQLTRMSAALALTSDVAMLMLGGALKRKERLSARLGDVLSYLYLATSALKYYNDNQKSADDLLHVHWTVQYCLYNIQKAFNEFFENFPVRWVGCLLRVLIFPWGRPYQLPSDKLSHQLARKMLESSAFRDRLTSGCYIGKTVDDATGRIEDAFKKIIAVAPLEKKLQDAVRNKVVTGGSFEAQLQNAIVAGVLTQKEVQQIQAAEAARLDVIQVDAF